MKIRYIVLAAVVLFSGCTKSQNVDRLFVGGTIHTINSEQPLAQVLAITDGRIVFVGNEDDSPDFAAAIVTDLAGAHLYPGFTDSHAHLFGIGQRESTLNLEGSSSLQEMLERVAAEADKNKTGIIVGNGWIETHWPEGRFPNSADLEKVVPGRVVILTRADRHALLASNQALSQVGIDRSTTAVQGGRILLDEAGDPTGILIDKSMELVAPLLSDPTAEQRKEILMAGASAMAEYGWTGLHNMSVGEKDVLQLEALAEQSKLPIRVYNGIDVEALELLSAGTRFGADNRVITRAIKIYTDGALGSRGAALLAPYSDDSKNSGFMLADKDITAALLQQALLRGWQINAHAIGDRANREILNWMEQALAVIPEKSRKIADPRWRIEHAQIIDLKDITRFVELGIIPSMQPSHAIGDLFFAPDRLGSNRLAGAYAWQTLLDTGSIIVAGSDAPVERGDPRIEFYAAVSRTSVDGFQGNNWRKEQAVSRENALKMFTIWPAIASFQEQELGSIEVGKRADFTVFDRDLLTVPAPQILDAVVLWTIVDGKDSYKAKP